MFKILVEELRTFLEFCVRDSEVREGYEKRMNEFFEMKFARRLLESRTKNQCQLRFCFWLITLDIFGPVAHDEPDRLARPDREVVLDLVCEGGVQASREDPRNAIAKLDDSS